MGVRWPTATTTTLVTGTIVTTAETVILTTPPLTLPLDFAQVMIFWYHLLLVGTGGVTATVNLRRGTAVSSTLINISQGVTVAAGNRVVLAGCYIDTPGAVGGQQYSTTITVGSATANSTVNDGALLAFAL